MPPSGFSKKAVQGALIFIQSCYEDLLAEVRAGKYKSFEEGIEKEIEQIKNALSDLHIGSDGKLTAK